MANGSFLLQFPQKLEGKALSDLEGELGEMDVSVADVYHADGVPDFLPKAKLGSRLDVASGIESVFYGNPPAEFDFEARLKYVFGDEAIISKGTHPATGGQLWIARSSYFFPATDEEIRQGIDAAAMAAMAAMGMHNMGAKAMHGSQHTFESREEVPGLKEILRTAREYGIKSTIFCNGSGVPYMRRTPHPKGSRYQLVEGTEVLIEFDRIPNRIKKLQSRYEGLFIHAAFPFRRMSA